MVEEFVLSLEDMKNASRSKYLLDWKGLFFILCAERSDKATIMYSIFRINWKFHIGIRFYFNGKNCVGIIRFKSLRKANTLSSNTLQHNNPNKPIYTDIPKSMNCDEALE